MTCAPVSLPPDEYCTLARVCSSCCKAANNTTAESSGSKQILPTEPSADTTSIATNDNDQATIIFWDIQNMRIPKSYSISTALQRIRSKAPSKVLGFYVYDSINYLSKEIKQEFRNNDVDVKAVPSQKPGAADMQIIHDMLSVPDKFHLYKLTFVLISGDSDFTPVILSLAQKGIPVVLICNVMARLDLRAAASSFTLINHLLADDVISETSVIAPFLVTAESLAITDTANPPPEPATDPLVCTTVDSISDPLDSTETNLLMSSQTSIATPATRNLSKKTSYKILAALKQLNKEVNPNGTPLNLSKVESDDLSKKISSLLFSIEPSSSTSSAPLPKSNNKKPKSECHICKKKFKNSVKFRNHLRTHAAIIQTCPVCSKSFKSTNALANHCSMTGHDIPILPVPSTVSEEVPEKKVEEYTDKLRSRVKSIMTRLEFQGQILGDLEVRDTGLEEAEVDCDELSID